MNAKRISAAAGVIHAAMQTRQTAAGIAAALESACLLQSPESAAELLALKVRVSELEAEVEAGSRAVDADPIAFSLTEKAATAGMTAAELGRTPTGTSQCRCGHWDNVHGPFCFAADCECGDFTRPQVAKLRELLARQAEDPHTSPLHHEYRIGRDLEVRP